MLVLIKLLHTAVWAFFVGCIVSIPVMALRQRFRAAAMLSAIVLGECAVLAINQLRCPLTDVAARYTAERSPNFDIYLPLWLAENNKLIFGWLFLGAELLLFFRWLLSRRRSLSRDLVVEKRQEL